MEVLEAKALPAVWSAQRAELWTLIRALQLSKDKRANIYTDSRYAFATVHIHGAIYKERGLLTSEGKTIKNKSEILQLLEAVWAPQRLAITLCRGHQKGNNEPVAGNRLADHAAKAAAQDTDAAIIASPPQPCQVLPTPQQKTAGHKMRVAPGSLKVGGYCTIAAYSYQPPSLSASFQNTTLLPT